MPVKKKIKNKPKVRNKPGPKGPFVWTDEFKSALLADMLEYIESTPVPILEEFAKLKGIWSQRLHEHPEFAEPLKRLRDAKIAGLERGAMRGEINATVAIWGLKQLGQTDNQKIEHSGSIESKVIKMTKEEREQRKAELLQKLRKGT